MSDSSAALREPSPALREPWEALTDQKEASVFAIWIFLASELLFFGALFLVYAFLRTLHPQAFALAAGKTNLTFGTVNTGLLLTSGLTMALASNAVQSGASRLTSLFLGLTAGLGLAFVAVKGMEYHDDIRQSLVPGPGFALPPAAQLFFSFYWISTSIHLVHLLIGIALVSRLAVDSARKTLPLASPQFEVVALYWALVDAVWVVLYALLYLGGRW
ncbi:cytochrome c oxidase subunit 3 [Rhodoblastus sp.]|uniref:cytochrome c oxidase subunit 3 n=1 Tax=Rhodoblastus sp. TaxID=1962975 RepID=UPI003F9E441A